jgi:hypothetical protein
MPCDPIYGTFMGVPQLSPDGPFDPPKCGVEYPLWRRDGDAMVAVTQEWVDDIQRQLKSWVGQCRMHQDEIYRLQGILNDFDECVEAPTTTLKQAAERYLNRRAQSAEAKPLPYPDDSMVQYWKDRCEAHKADLDKVRASMTAEEYARILEAKHYANEVKTAPSLRGVVEYVPEEPKSDYNSHAWECLRASARG